MSYSHSKSLFCNQNFNTSSEPIVALEGSAGFIRSADRAIDNALRNVPLPEGLLRRLSQMASTVSDGVSDSVDYLGC
jgi:hypothetical protein